MKTRIPMVIAIVVLLLPIVAKHVFADPDGFGLSESEFQSTNQRLQNAKVDSLIEAAQSDEKKLAATKDPKLQQMYSDQLQALQAYAKNWTAPQK